MKKSMVMKPLATAVLFALSASMITAIADTESPDVAEVEEVIGAAESEEAEADDIIGNKNLQGSSRIERIQVSGRLLSSAAITAAERRDNAQVADFLDAEMISRIGDSDVGAALRRITGLTLVDNKFIYVRGLGERYSSTLLNGAMVPSPDPTRNVVPLDMFPTGILDRLAVQKTLSADQPATFGGGGVDIKTLSIPRERIFEVSVGTGYSTMHDEDGLSYAGGGDDWRGRDDGTRSMSSTLQDALDTYGSLEPIPIAQALGGVTPTNLARAEEINRGLGLALNRNYDITPDSSKPDMDASVTFGDRLELTDKWVVGMVASASYDRSRSNSKEQERYYSITSGNELTPLVQYDDIQATSDNVQLSGILNLGIEYDGNHRLQTTSLYLLDTQDEVKIKTGDTIETINELNRENVDYSVMYEERSLVSNQIRGEHRFDFLADLGVKWQYTDSQARRYAPGQVDYRYIRNMDSEGNQTALTMRRSDNAALIQFGDMRDDMEYGTTDLKLPLSLAKWELELQSGYAWQQRQRTAENDRFKLDSRGFSNEELQQSFSELFSDANISDAGNRFRISDVTAQADDYVAAQTLDAGYLAIDALYDYTWRFNLGARYESFRQISIPLNPATGEVEGNLEDYPLVDKDWYPSLAATWLFHPDMQLRFGISESVVRPDIREVTPVLFVDPITDFLVVGFQDLAPSKITNIDTRWEWYLESGSSLSVGAFYKDIDAPIETVEIKGSDGNLQVSFRNAEKGNVYGVEFEFVRTFAEIEFIPNWASDFFLAGNVTLSDSDISIQRLGESNITNLSRRLSGHSRYVVNTQLGYDAPNERHSATLSYNVFGPRISFAGVDGKDDAFEQPFHSLDFTYSYYPRENLAVKLGLKNLLNEKTEILQQGQIVQMRERGTAASLSATFKF